MGLLLSAMQGKDVTKDLLCPVLLNQIVSHVTVCEECQRKLSQMAEEAPFLKKFFSKLTLPKVK